MKIKETKTGVSINGFEFEGHIDEDQSCTDCHHFLIYSDEFDAYFCPNCNEWIESKCSDPTCFYCPKRPDQPLPKKMNT
ncbi:hypothetical protein [Bacillus sp. AK128]